MDAKKPERVGRGWRKSSIFGASIEPAFHHRGVEVLPPRAGLAARSPRIVGIPESTQAVTLDGGEGL